MKQKVETVVGKLKVLKYFSSMKHRHLIGGRVEEGEIVKDAYIRIIRGDEKIGTGNIESMQKAKNDVSRVEVGDECGLFIKSDTIPEPGDILESIREDEV